MERMYRVIDKCNEYYILHCASYGFSNDEEIMSATNDIACTIEKDLIIGAYVKFENETIEKTNDKYYVSGDAVMYRNCITDEDREEYDKEFELSIKAYIDNDVDGIQKWQEYLKTYEDKFMKFERI